METDSGSVASANISEIPFESFFRNHGAIMLLMDGETGRLIDVNDTALRFYGYSMQQIQSMKIEDINKLPPDELDAERQRALKEQRTYFIVPHQLANGQIRTVEVHTTPISFGNKKYLFSIIHDITERKKAEKALKESEEKYRILVDSSNEAVMVAQDGILKFVNRRAMEMTGYSERELTTRPFPEFIHPDDRAMVIENYKNRLKGDFVQPRYTFRIVTIEDAAKWVEIGAALIEWEGKPATLNFLTDITERRRAEEAMRESEEKYQTLAEAAFEGIAITSGGVIIQANRQLADLLGYTVSELCGKPVMEFISPESRERIRAVMEQKTPNSFEHQLLCKNGKSVQVEGFVRGFKINEKMLRVVAIRDITQRKRMEDALRHSKAALKKAQKVAHVGSWSWHIKTNRLEWSDEMYRIFGIDKQEFSGDLTEVISRAIHPEDRAAVENSNLSVIQAKKPIPVEYRIVWPDKTIRTVWAEAGELILDEAGNPELLTGIVQDITGRKKAEEQMLVANERLQYLLSSSSVVIYTAKTSGDYGATFISNNTAQMVGYDAEEFIRDSNFWYDHIHPKDQVIVSEEVPKLFKKDLHAYEYRFKCKNGGYIWIRDEMRLVRDHNGNPLEIIGFWIDITERKRAEEALLESEARFRKIFEEAHLGIVITSPAFKFEKANPAFCRMMGYSEEELCSMTFADITHPDHLKQDMENVKKVGRGEIPFYQTEKRYINKSGQVLWGNLIVSSIRDEQGALRYYLSMVNDITERKQTEETLRNIQRLESLGVLAGGIAHDFNNLMGGIFGYIDMAREDSKDAKVSAVLAKAMNTIDRARGLTQQLLTFAKGGAPVQEVTPLFPFVQDTAQFALSGSNISCRFDVAENLWLCNIDKNQISQVIDNIFINAQQAMPNGGTIEVTAKNVSLGEKEHIILPAGNYVKISIKDCGIGIPGEILPRIFDPFYTTKTKGHGLGLATCYSIVKRHGGAIDVESEQGHGSTFHIYLPASAQAFVEKKTTAVKHKGSGTVLVLDDEEVMRDTIGVMLKSLGYTPVCMQNSKEVLDFYKKETGAGRAIAAMIFDLTVPGDVGGKEAVARIRKLNVEIPVFVSSGYADDPIMKNPADYGFTASISKPFRLAELGEMLEKHLKKKK